MSLEVGTTSTRVAHAVNAEVASRHLSTERSVSAIHDTNVQIKVSFSPLRGFDYRPVQLHKFLAQNGCKTKFVTKAVTHGLAGARSLAADLFDARKRVVSDMASHASI